MNVGILTFPHSPSYGASLQMHALYKTVEQLGCTPYVLNYQNKYMLNKCHIEQSIIKAKVLNLVGHKTKKRFDTFEKTIRWLPESTIRNPTELHSLSDELDCIIVGSDQVWNPSVTGEDISYFLNFCDTQKKISYAASFGVDTLEPSFESKITPLLLDIPALSVREQKGKEIIKRLTERDATVVLDPVFLQEKEYWERMAYKRRIIEQPYIFSFIFNPNKENMAFRSRLSKEMGLPIVSISDNPLKRSNKEFVNISGVGPKEFLSLVKDAEYIISDSFHGTAFSIIFNRPFCVSLSTKTNSRLETLLSTLGLQNCILTQGDTIIDNIDYVDINESISLWREKSLSFLKAALLR